MADLLNAAGALKLTTQRSRNKGTGELLIYVQYGDSTIACELSMDATPADLKKKSGLLDCTLTFQGKTLEPEDEMLADLGLSNEVTVVAEMSHSIFTWDKEFTDSGHRPDLFEQDEETVKKVRDDGLTYTVRTKLKNPGGELPREYSFKVRVDEIPDHKYNGGYYSSDGGCQRQYDGIGLSKGGTYMCESGIRVRMNDGKLLKGYTELGQMRSVKVGDTVEVYAKDQEEGKMEVTFTIISDSKQARESETRVVESDFDAHLPAFQVEKTGWKVTIV